MDDVQVHEESEARLLLGAATATIAGGGDLLGGVRRRRAARKRRRRIALAAGSGAAAVVVAAGTLLSVSAADAPSASAVASAAVSRMSTASFHFSMVAKGPFAFGDSPASRLRVTGDFDLARHIAKETVSGAALGQPVDYELRYLHGTVYQSTRVIAGHPTRWSRTPDMAAPGRFPVGALGVDFGTPLSARDALLFSYLPASPQDLLALVRSAAAVRMDGPASGPGWTGTRFSFRSTAGKNIVGEVRVTGALDVDQQGRLRRLELTRHYTQVQGAPRTYPGFSQTDDMVFSDFGAPVSVSAPPGAQIVKPSTAPSR